MAGVRCWLCWGMYTSTVRKLQNLQVLYSEVRLRDSVAWILLEIKRKFPLVEIERLCTMLTIPLVPTCHDSWCLETQCQCLLLQEAFPESSGRLLQCLPPLHLPFAGTV